MPRLQFHLYVNVERRILTDSAGDPLGGDRLQEFFREESGVLCFHCFRDDGAVWPFGVSDAFEFGTARDWDQTTDPDVFSEDDQFNIAGDWDAAGFSQINPAFGLICCRYNTNTTAFNTAFSANPESLDAGLYLKLIDLTNGNVTLCQYPATYRNIRRTAGGTPPGVESPTYPTTVQMTAAVATRAPLAAVRHVFWPASSAVSRTTAGAAPGAVELATNDVMLGSYDFDTAADEAVQFSGYLEHWGASTIKVKPVWTAASGTGTVCWSASARALANDDALDQAFGTAQSSTDTLITANDEHVGPATAAITVAGTPANGQRLQLQILRDVSEDTLNADACLLGVWIEYTEAATEEAAW
jgi:hypothetical protein